MLTILRDAMKINIGVLLFIFSGFVTADNCMSTHMEAQRLKSKMIMSIKTIDTDYAFNTDALLKQYEELTDDLSVTRRLADISENVLKYCAGGRFTKEIYDVTDKTTVFITITGSFYMDDIGKKFQERYIVPNNNWTQVANSVEKDILNKRKEIKLAIEGGVKKELKKEEELNKKLTIEQKEVEELKALLTKKKAIEQENKKLKASIEKTKGSSTPSKNIKQSTRIASNKNLTSIDTYTDKMASYAAVIGRGAACGGDPNEPLTRVGSWMDEWFADLNVSPKMQSNYLVIFMQGTEYHMKQQQAGNSPDSCSSALNTFNSIRWP